MIWWAVSLDWDAEDGSHSGIQSEDDSGRWFLALARRADLTANIRSLQLGNRGLRCSVLAEDADGAVAAPTAWYKSAAGHTIAHLSATRAMPEGDRNVH